MKTQSESTINAVINLANDKNYECVPFETVYKDVLTKDDEKQVGDIIYKGIVSQEIQLSEKSQIKFKNDPKALRRYVTGLVNDRLRKAKALNGNSKYEFKNPGKLKSSRDPELQALLAVKSTLTKPEDILEVDLAIKVAQDRIDLANKKTVTINLDVLPENIRLMLEALNNK